MLKERNFFYHYIPSVERKSESGEKSKRLKIIGIIDSSGSMTGVWNYVRTTWNQLVQDVGEEYFTTITFDHNVHHKADTPYLADQYSHGGGGTNIFVPFQYFEQTVFPTIDSNTELKVIFISDGQDGGALQNNHQRLSGGLGRDISIMCVGV